MNQHRSKDFRWAIVALCLIASAVLDVVNQSAASRQQPTKLYATSEIEAGSIITFGKDNHVMALTVPGEFISVTTGGGRRQL